MDSFILRGTIPVPKGTYDGTGKQPFGVVDTDGETYGAQAEIVSRYPDDADGADVVEVLARVTRGSASPGSPVQYKVVLAEHDAQPDPGAAGTEDLKNGPLAIPTSVQALLNDLQSIEIRSHDVFGNEYKTWPLNDAGEETLTRYGEHMAQMRVAQVLAPNPPKLGATGTLYHFFTAHSYVATMNSEEIVLLDLRITNADSGSDKTTFVDDPNDKVYFKDLEIMVPNGWVVVQDYDDPFWGNAYNEGVKTVQPVVKPLSGGKMHVIPWGGQFHRRLAIAKIGLETRARDYLQGDNLGFCVRGVDPDEGHTYWSWWNPATARYFPQSHLLPIFDHMGKGSIKSSVRSDRDMVQGHLENGTDTGGQYPFQSGVLGWAHPYGVSYGGMTGGAEIIMFDGMRTAWAATPAGFELARIMHRMHTDRMPNALYDLDGQPATVTDWIKQSGSTKYVPFWHFMKPDLSSGDPFGVKDALQFQIQYVNANNLKPSYEGQLLSFDPHDYQHFIRYTHSAKVLAWLANDSVAIDDLRMQAENFRLSYHTNYNSASGLAQPTGLRWDQDYVIQHPASGFRWGRGEGWGVDCTNAAYATSPPEWRAARLGWYDMVADLVNDGQGSCNGFLQANINPKFVGGKYRARQAIEHYIMENAILGMVETVYRGKDSATTAMLEDVLEDSYYAGIGPMAWWPGQNGPYQYTAVAPKDEFQPIWCSAAQIPGDGYTAYVEAYQNPSNFAYGYNLTQDQTFLNFASTQFGNPTSLLNKLENDGLTNIGNKAGLLALMQHLNGDF